MADETEEIVETLDDSDEEPKVTSSNPEERKLARSIRIKNRLETLRKQNLAEDDEFIEEYEKTITDKQLEKSAAVLDTYLIEGDEAVTNVIIGNDAREVNRRDKEAARRAELNKQLEEEANEAEELFKQIEEQWTKIKNYKDPVDINDAITAQKERCDELIKQKDEIIAMLREEINIADKKYDKDMELQSDDIDTLITRIDEQVILMRHAYHNELELIQDALEVESEMLSEKTQKTWETLSKEREEKEETHLARRTQYVQDYMKTTTKLKFDALEKYRETKVTLQAETQALLLELHKIKTTCSLNIEKLNYNYEILKKRENENVILRLRQKREMTKLRDQINNMKKASEEYEKEANQKISRLNSDIRKCKNTIIGLKRKAENIRLTNEWQYEKVWDMNEEIVKDLYKQLLEADRIIHEDILGVKWNRKKLQFRDKEDLPSRRAALEVIEARKAKLQPHRKLFLDPIEVKNNVTELALNKMTEQASFALDDIFEVLLQPYEDDQKQLAKIDRVFDVLKIQDDKQLNRLMKFFAAYAYCPICKEEDPEKTELENIPYTPDFRIMSSTTVTSSVDSLQLKLADIKDMITAELQGKQKQDEEEEIIEEIASEEVSEIEEKECIHKTSDNHLSVQDFQCSVPRDFTLCEQNHPLFIDSFNVMSAMMEFKKEYSVDPKSVAQYEAEVTSISRLIKDEDVQSFWGQFQNCFTRDDELLWDTILYAINQYHEALAERQKLDNEIKQLDKMNKELKFLLKNCGTKTKEMLKLKKKVKKSNMGNFLK